MLKQLYRFQILRELSSGIWSAVDEGSESSVQLVEVPLDPKLRESQMVELRRIAAERGCEGFSADSSYYLVASTPAQAGEVRKALLAQKLVLPPAADPPLVRGGPATRTLWMWGAAVVAITLTAIALVSEGKHTTSSQASPSDQHETATTQTEPPLSDPVRQLNEGAADFKAKHYESARALFDSSCKGGNANACGYLAFVLAKGLGGPFDTRKAIQLYRSSCDQGVTHSCMSLGYIYRSSNRANESRTYFEKACAEKMQDGCVEAQRVK